VKVCGSVSSLSPPRSARAGFRFPAEVQGTQPARLHELGPYTLALVLLLSLNCAKSQRCGTMERFACFRDPDGGRMELIADPLGKM
jgi:hypothetical protein